MSKIKPAGSPRSTAKSPTKTVEKKKVLTNSGILPSSNTARTIKLSQLSVTRAARTKRAAEAAGLKRAKDFSKRTGLPVGTVTRTMNSQICLDFKKSYQISNSMFRKPQEIGEQNSSKIDSKYYSNSYFVSPDWLLHGLGKEPQKVVVPEGFDLQNFLLDQFSRYSDSESKRINNMIDGNNATASPSNVINDASSENQSIKGIFQHKNIDVNPSLADLTEESKAAIINQFLVIDLFLASNKHAYIAYPSETYGRTNQRAINGFILSKTPEEIMKLDGRECVVILKEGDIPLVRSVKVLENHLLLTSLDDAGALIVSLDEMPYAIGEVALVILNYTGLLDKVAEAVNYQEIGRYQDIGNNDLHLIDSY